MTTTPAARLSKLDTPALIEQYDQAVSSHKGRYTETAPRQQRINKIVDLLTERADADDPDALRWFENDANAPKKPAAPKATPGEATLGVTTSARGRTTTVTLPDGTTEQRTSKTREYTHAVVVTTDNHNDATDLQVDNARRQKFVDALQQWIDEGSDTSKLKGYPTGSLSYAERQAGVKPTEYYLPGFEPTRVQGRTGDTWENTEFSLPNFKDTRKLSWADGRTEWEEYGPEHVLKRNQETIDKQAKKADQLLAGPRYSYGVWRWSSSPTAAQAAASQFGNYRNRSTQVIGVGGVAEAKKATKPVLSAEEKAAQAEVRKLAAKAAEKARNEASNAEFVQRKLKSVAERVTSGVDTPDTALSTVNDRGLSVLAKELGVKTPRGYRTNRAIKDAYERSIVEAIMARANARKSTARLADAEAAAQKAADRLEGAAALNSAPAKVRDGKLSLPGWGDGERADAADALEHYRDVGFADLNRDLRAGVPGSDKGRQTTATVDKVMAASPLPQPVTVHRGVEDAGHFKVGQVITDPTYSSTSVDFAVAKGFAGKGGAVLRMQVPAGVGAVNLSDVPGARHDEREGELLLQRGLHYRVVSESTVNGVRVFDVVIEPGPITPVRAGTGRRPGGSRPTGPPKFRPRG
jgi:ADP-ribosyltransferase exoenzyme